MKATTACMAACLLGVLIGDHATETGDGWLYALGLACAYGAAAVLVYLQARR